MLNVPNNFTAGDRIIWFTEPLSGTNLDTGAPIEIAPPAFTLSFAFRGAGFLDVTASNDSGRFKSIIPSADSSTLNAGILTWQAYVTDGNGDRSTVGAGQTLVMADLSIATTAPPTERQKLQILLDKVNAAIEALIAGKPIQEYEINGRKLRYLPMADLVALRDTLHKDLFRAQSAALNAAGKNRRRRFIRFDQPGGR